MDASDSIDPNDMAVKETSSAPYEPMDLPPLSTTIVHPPTPEFVMPFNIQFDRQLILKAMKKAADIDDLVTESLELKNLRALRKRGVTSGYWTEAQFNQNTKIAMDTMTHDDLNPPMTDSDSNDDLASLFNRPIKKPVAPSTALAAAKTVYFDSLIGPIDHVWLQPYHCPTYRQTLSLIKLPLFLGNRSVDTITAAQWCKNISNTFFVDVGVPLPDAVRLLRRCFPDDSRTAEFFTAHYNENPNISYDSFMRKFVPAFTDTGLVAITADRLFTIRQHHLPMWQFAAEHSNLWNRVNPGTTESAKVLDWTLRLNPACSIIFNKYIQRLREKHQLPSYQHALDHMEDKLRQKDTKVDTRVPQKIMYMGDPEATVMAITHPPLSTSEFTPCPLGCRYRKHRVNQKCPGLNVTCHRCNIKGHFKQSKICPMYGTKNDDLAKILAIAKDNLGQNNDNDLL
jgi:hypothetical protein